MTLKFLQGMALAAVLSGVCTTAHAQTQQPAEKDPVVARVDGQEIKRSDVVSAQQALPEQYRQLPLQSIFQPLLREMINSMLLVRAARAEGLQNDPDVKRQVARLEGQVLEQNYLRRIISTQVTDEALRKNYQETIVSAADGGEDEVRARHILVKTEAEAMAVIDELIKNKADFAELAQSKSIGPSNSRGGDLGFFAKGAMVKPFADAAFAMKPGDITRKPVKTQFGWHVIKVEERRKGSVPSFEESRQKLTGEMTQRVIKDTVGALRKGAAIETFGLDGGAAPAPVIRRVQ